MNRLTWVRWVRDLNSGLQINSGKSRNTIKIRHYKKMTFCICSRCGLASVNRCYQICRWMNISNPELWATTLSSTTTDMEKITERSQESKTRRERERKGDARMNRGLVRAEKTPNNLWAEKTQTRDETRIDKHKRNKRKF